MRVKNEIIRLLSEGIAYNSIAEQLENLQLLCPNCHSQTPNFSGRNASR